MQHMQARWLREGRGVPIHVNAGVMPCGRALRWINGLLTVTPC